MAPRKMERDVKRGGRRSTSPSPPRRLGSNRMGRWTPLAGLALPALPWPCRGADPTDRARGAGQGAGRAVGGRQDPRARRAHPAGLAGSACRKCRDIPSAKPRRAGLGRAGGRLVVQRLRSSTAKMALESRAQAALVEGSAPGHAQWPSGLWVWRRVGRVGDLNPRQRRA